MYGFKRIKKNLKKNKFRTMQESFLAPRLNKQFQILEPSQTESDEGGFIQDYTTLKTIWGGIETVTHTAYRRWSSVEGFGSVSHTIIFRRNAVDDLHTQFSTGFSTGFETIADLMPLKNDLFLGLEQGSTTKRRIFKILRMMDVDEKREYLSCLCQEIEEQGTGFQGNDY